MAYTVPIRAAIQGFHDIILKGVPFLHRQNDTAFLSFMCCVSAIDTLAAYRYDKSAGPGKRFEQFILNYFPPAYAPHAKNLWVFRCRLLHNFSPAHFSLAHDSPSAHLTKSPGGDTILSDREFFADLDAAARRFFGEVETDPIRQDLMNARLADLAEGGPIFYLG